MAARRFTARTVIARPAADVFAWVADPGHVPLVLEGVERWQPLDGRAGGVGARFDVRVRALGVAAETVLVLDRWEEPRVIGWRSESGPVAHSGGWRFAPRGAGTEVALAIDYEPPGGVLGGLVAARVDGVLRERLQRALERMRDLLERPPDGA
jgi:uncharacterized membrane protein